MKAALTGFMASGKTTFGRAAAERLGWRFIDLDKVIEERHGTASAIFEEHGEDFFRGMESRCLSDILSEEGDAVLALGGGTVLSLRNREMLKRLAMVIWLDTSWEIILSEMDNADRPLAKGRTEAQIRELYDSRRPVYNAVADATVTIDSQDYTKAIKDLADTIQRLASAGQ